MAKADKTKVPAITLGEFCTRLSMTDKRVELIGGYHADEVKSGNVKDSEENFKSRFDVFIKRPV